MQNEIDNLYKTLTGSMPFGANKPYDEEAEFIKVLPKLEYTNAQDFSQDSHSNHQQLRSRIRYLAALFPDKNFRELSFRVHGLINNSNMTLEDIRLILDGRKLSDPSKKTREISVAIIQGIGKCLKDGMSLKATAEAMKVSYDTVEAIENYIGIRSAFKQNQLDDAITLARENISVRKLAKHLNISRSTAHRLLIQANEVLKELGEL